MGLIKAIAGAAGGVLADQWKEFFYCESMSADVLCVKGKKKVTKRSSNTKGDENIISNGSVVSVADGQCMLIVEQGKVVEVCAEPGEFMDRVREYGYKEEELNYKNLMDHYAVETVKEEADYDLGFEFYDFEKDLFIEPDYEKASDFEGRKF